MLAAAFATVLSNSSAGAAVTPFLKRASRNICVDPPPAVQVPRMTPVRSSPSGGMDRPRLRAPAWSPRPRRRRSDPCGASSSARPTATDRSRRSPRQAASGSRWCRNPESAQWPNARRAVRRRTPRDWCRTPTRCRSRVHATGCRTRRTLPLLRCAFQPRGRCSAPSPRCLATSVLAFGSANAATRLLRRLVCARPARQRRDQDADRAIHRDHHVLAAHQADHGTRTALGRAPVPRGPALHRSGRSRRADRRQSA